MRERVEDLGRIAQLVWDAIAELKEFDTDKWKHWQTPKDADFQVEHDKLLEELRTIRVRVDCLDTALWEIHQIARFGDQAE